MECKFYKIVTLENKIQYAIIDECGENYGLVFAAKYVDDRYYTLFDKNDKIFAFGSMPDFKEPLHREMFNALIIPDRYLILGDSIKNIKFDKNKIISVTDFEGIIERY